MKYRGRECTESRSFMDATGTGLEWRHPNQSATKTPWLAGELGCIREHSKRVVSQAELDANAAAAAAADDAGKRAAALALLVDETIAKRPDEVSAKLQAMREAPTPALGVKLR